MSVGLPHGPEPVPATSRSRRSRRWPARSRVALVAAVAEAPARGVHAAPAWPFLLAGLMQPGIGQLFVTLAIREAGASRASVVLGSAPLASVTIALIFLGEPVRWPLIVGAVLIVAGGVELARDRGAARRTCAARLRLRVRRDDPLLGARQPDALARGQHGGAAGVAAAAALAGGTVAHPRRARPARSPRGSRPADAAVPRRRRLFGLSYVSLFEAYYRGRVTVVSPLVATEALWGVLLSLLFLRQTELVGRRVVAGAVLVVAGSALIGVFR